MNNHVRLAVLEANLENGWRKHGIWRKGPDRRTKIGFARTALGLQKRPQKMILSIDACTVDTDTYELRRDGTIIPVEPQVFDLLILLLENPDRVVTKEEIIERVWQGRIVSEATISSRIKAARQALGDDGANQKQIRTIRGRGFRIVRTVQQVGRAIDATIKADTGTGSPQFDLDLPQPDKPSIVVLPFDDLSAGDDRNFFAESITNDIITELSRFRSLFVIAPNSSFAFAAPSHDVESIGWELGVRYVVQGNVRQSSGRLRISVKLTQASNGRLIWAERYDRNLEDIFAVQDDVTRAIVANIEPQLASSERHRARNKPPDSLEAWESYQRALWHLYRYNAKDIDTALDLFQ